MLILYIYLAFIFICLFKSITMIKKSILFYHSYLWLYLLITFSLECYGTYKMTIKEYNFAWLFNYYSIFLLIFFFIYYFKILTQKLKKVSLFAFAIIFIWILFFTKFYDDNYDNTLGLLVSSYLIINTLIWYYYRLINFDNRKITDDPNFWLSSALLFWSIFFIFRTIPMFFLYKNDPEFLQLLKTIQYCVNIIMYGLYYVAILKFENNAKLKM